MPGGPGVPGQPDFVDPMKGIGRLRSLIGLFSQVAAAGVAAGVAIKTAWDAFFDSGITKANKFKETLDLSDLKGSTSALQKEYQDLAARLESSQSSIFGSAMNLLTGDTEGKLKEQLAEIEKTLRNQQQAVNAQTQRDREKKEADEKAARERAEQEEVASIRKRVEASRIALLEGEDKILAQARADQAEIDRQFGEAKTDAAKAALLEEFNLRAAQYERDIDAFRTNEAEKKKASDERLAAEAAAQEREIQRAADMFQQFVRQRTQELKAFQDQNNQVFSASGIEANAGNVGIILTTLSAQMAGISESLVQSVKTSPYE
jgi:hypothetical protein